MINKDELIYKIEVEHDSGIVECAEDILKIVLLLIDNK